MSNYVFQVSQLPILDLKIACSVSISSSDSNSVEIEVSGDEADKVIVSQSGNKVVVDCKNVSSTSGNSIIINDGNRSVFMSGSSNISIGSIGGSRSGVNISGVSGKVFINGQEIDLSQNSDGTKADPLTIRIKAPLCSLVLDGKGHTEFDASTAKIQDAFVSLAGSGNVILKAKSLDAQITGSADLDVLGMDGTLSASVSGSADVTAEGRFSEVRVQVSGSGDVKTTGTCTGNYSALVSGSGDVRHYGVVNGHVRKSVSGSGTVKVQGS